jgi:lactate permease
VYAQNYDPLGLGLLSTIAAAVPIVTLLYFIAAHPHRDARGQRQRGVSAPWAAFAGVIASFVIALIVMRMPPGAAVSAFIAGALNGAIGIVWIIVGAMLLYTIALISGKFEIVKESITHISFDRRLQCLLIAFSFGAIIEGTSGFGTPVAIAGSMMVGLGFARFQSAVLNLLANTAPVAWGAIGSPIGCKRTGRDCSPEPGGARGRGAGQTARRGSLWPAWRLGRALTSWMKGV